jgi:hypothetical protein
VITHDNDVVEEMDDGKPAAIDANTQDIATQAAIIALTAVT